MKDDYARMPKARVAIDFKVWIARLVKVFPEWQLGSMWRRLIQFILTTMIRFIFGVVVGCFGPPAIANPGATVESNGPIALLTIDDVLSLQRVDQTLISPDGAWIAVVVQRPAQGGEVFGRNAYEIDPSRSDIILFSTATGKRKNLTAGAKHAAGYWCVAWSPDSRRLAMLSTEPEGKEPRGGSNVHVYVWDRAADHLARAMPDAVPTQMRYGGPYEKMDLRGGADGAESLHQCSGHEESAPYLWLDENHLLAATLPPGEVSALLDVYSRPSTTSEADAAALKWGKSSTGRAVRSGAARDTHEALARSAIVKAIDVRHREARTLAVIPRYPYRGALTISVSPDRQRLAVLATTGAVRPEDGKTLPNAYDDMWTVERRLGFVDLAGSRGVEWVDPSAQVRSPLALHEWSPDGARVVISGRPGPFTAETSFAVIPATGGVSQVIEGPVGRAPAMLTSAYAHPVFWSDDSTLLAQTAPGVGAGDTGWVLLHGSENNEWSKTNLDLAGATIRRARDGHLLVLTSKELLRLRSSDGAQTMLARFDDPHFLAWPTSPGVTVDRLLIGREVDGKTYFRTVNTEGSLTDEVAIEGDEIVDAALPQDVLVVSERGATGTRLREVNLATDGVRTLLSVNGFMKQVKWGEKRLIQFTGHDGRMLNGAAILPPGYRAGQRYPTLLWVYLGYEVGSLENDFFLDPGMPGVYNLELYAARGYVVLIPSLPLDAKAKPGDLFSSMTKDVIAAADRLIELGIADPDRLGVFGQSRGGYTVMGLLTQTDRFKAGVSMAGISDLDSYFGEFDPLAFGTEGIAHEKSDNWEQVSQFGLNAPPYIDPADYALVSPLTYVANVRTPLLLIHGDLDMRGPPSQSERFFYALYSQGRTAELVRYGGESHSLAQSPANIRDIYARTVAWFDRFLVK